jgi:hypothetical protein
VRSSGHAGALQDLLQSTADLSLTGFDRGANILFEWPSGQREGGTRIMDETTGTTTVSAGAGAENQAPYRVLARKYRPKDFTDLIGQEPMVRTLTNAFSPPAASPRPGC